MHYGDPFFDSARPWFGSMSQKRFCMMIRNILTGLLVLAVAGSCRFDGGGRNAQQYAHLFNPAGGLVSSEELPFRSELCLNGKWQFMPVYEDSLENFMMPKKFVWDSVQIKIPSPWNVNAFAKGDGGDFVTYPSYPRKWEKANIGWMKREFVLPESWTKKILKLHFEAIAGRSKIYINGQLVGENLDIFFPTEIDATPFIHRGRNEILVGVAKASLTDQQGRLGRRSYVAGSFWGQHIAGIWQDVHLLALPELSVENVFVNPDLKNKELSITATIHNYSTTRRMVNGAAIVKTWERKQAKDINDQPYAGEILGAEVLNFSASGDTELPGGSTATITLKQPIDGQLNHWTPDAPNLYGLTVELKAEDGAPVDRKFVRFGWRQFTIEGTKLLLNGKPIVLKGDSWHFMGVPQMTRRYAWGWYKMLKDAHANAVRLHAQPYPSFYLDVADELGICVLDETAIWSSDGGPKMDSEAYWSACSEHVSNLVIRDRNHPSVFGWSVCNETLPVAIHVFHASETIVQRQVDEINRWVSIVREKDPSRSWISGDGETMRPTHLPVVVGHYGDEHSMKEWSEQNKPWGVGETGMAYYGTPRQVARINGNRAYVSQLGRMEGLATEAYQTIGMQNKYGASYTSIFNLVWYGLKPLEFGMSDTTRAPGSRDGIFFPEHQDGIAGMQPERLGPYVSTINPGYDERLPLYKAWPLFDAVKAANSGTAFGLLPTGGKETTGSVNFVTSEKHVNAKAQLVANDASVIRQDLMAMGIDLEGRASRDKVVIVDADHMDSSQLSRQRFGNIVNNGAHVVIFNLKPRNLGLINSLLPYHLDLVERTGSSFVVNEPDQLLAGLGHGDFYFSEATDVPIMSYALAGEVVGKGRVLLSASRTDWRRWNFKGEDVKTAAVIRSEREATVEGNAIVKLRFGKGIIYLVALDLFALKSDGQEIIKRILSNTGVAFSEVTTNDQRALSENHYLERALLSNVTRTDLKQTGPAITVRVNAQGFVSLNRDGQSGKLSFWLFSPRSLINLLAEPDLPELYMDVEGKRELNVNVNLNVLSAGSHSEKSVTYRLPLEKGWNKLEIAVPESKDGQVRLKVGFRSNSGEFIGGLRSLVKRIEN